MQFPLKAKLKDETPVELLPAGNRDLPALAKLYDRIVAEGTSYPHERPVTEEEFLDCWVRGKSTVVAYERPRKTDAELLGAFYILSRTGRAAHDMWRMRDSSSCRNGGIAGWAGCSAL